MDTGFNRKEHIYSLISHIEENLSLRLDTKYLTELGFVSHMQLYRDFYSITGHSVKEYIRKRRLSNALALIKHSEMNLADISYECGYTSQQILCTSVKNAVGLTPLEYRKSGEVYYFPPFNRIRERQVTIETETIPERLCIKYYQSRLKEIENAAVQYFLSLVPDFTGRIFGRDGVQSGSRFCYKLYITKWEEVTEKLTGSSFVTDGLKPAVLSNFAMTTVKNQEDEISSGWDYLYTDWLGLSMFEYGDEPYYEEYLVKNRKIKKLRLYLPVRKKSDYTRITFEKPGSMKFIVSEVCGIDAERISSERVIGYLKDRYPYMIKNSKQFYVCKYGQTFTNGIRITEDLRPDENEQVHILRTPDCLYAVLSCGTGSDYSTYGEVLINWVKENGLWPGSNRVDSSDSVFAVYDVTSGYELPQVKLYCPVKMV